MTEKRRHIDRRIYFAWVKRKKNRRADGIKSQMRPKIDMRSAIFAAAAQNRRILRYMRRNLLRHNMRTAQYAFAKSAALYEERTSLLQRFICFFGRFSALHGAVTYKSAYFIHKIHRRRHLQGAKSVRFCAAAHFFSKTQIKNGQVINIMGRFLLFSDIGRRKNTRARPFEERSTKKTALRVASV